MEVQIVNKGKVFGFGDGPGKVIGGDVLQQTVDVLMSNGQRKSYEIKNIKRGSDAKKREKKES